MNAASITDIQIEAYLLGSVESELAETIDEFTFIDEDFAARVGAVERDLVDEYLRKELDAESLRRFESYYLRSPKRREIVRLGGSLGEFVASAVAAQQHPIRAEPVEAPKERLTGIWWKLGIPAFAAALLLAVAVPFWYNSSTTSQQANINADTNSNQLAQVQPTAQPSPPLQPASSPVANETPVNRPTANVRDTSQLVPRVFALTLLPQTRGSQGEERVSIPTSTDRVSVTIRLEPTDFRSVLVELSDRASGSVMWRANARPSKVSRGYQSVHLNLEASLLSSGSYSFRVSAAGGGTDREIIGDYPFSIVR